MKSKLPLGRQFGQPSLFDSSFLIKPSASSKDNEDLQEKKDKNKYSRISFSEFLNRKIDTTKTTYHQKQEPFSSPSLVGGKHTDDEGNLIKRETLTIDATVFKQFKSPPPSKEKQDYDSLTGTAGAGGCSSSTTDEINLRKRKYPFQSSSKGGEEKHTTRHLVILGDDPKPKMRSRDVRFIRDEKPKVLFNHYANGSGWWDCNRVGIDNEEIGCSEGWEGMGSTTLGGMQWH